MQKHIWYENKPMDLCVCAVFYVVILCSLKPSPRYQALLFCLRFMCYRDNEHSSFPHFFLFMLMWVCIMHTRCVRKHFSFSFEVKVNFRLTVWVAARWAQRNVVHSSFYVIDFILFFSTVDLTHLFSFIRFKQFMFITYTLKFVKNSVSIAGFEFCHFVFLTPLTGTISTSKPAELTNVLEICNIVFTSMFTLEMFLKLTAFGFFEYLRNPYNIFDGIIVIIRFVIYQIFTFVQTRNVMSKYCALIKNLKCKMKKYQEIGLGVRVSISLRTTLRMHIWRRSVVKCAS